MTKLFVVDGKSTKVDDNDVVFSVDSPPLPCGCGPADCRAYYLKRPGVKVPGVKAVNITRGTALTGGRSLKFSADWKWIGGAGLRCKHGVVGAESVTTS